MWKILSVLLIAASLGATPAFSEERLWTERASAVPSADVPVNSGTFSRLVEGLLPAVVSISVKSTVDMMPFGRTGDPFFDYFYGRGQQQQKVTEGLGTGFIINKSGYILTNNHVIENADEISVKLHDGNRHTAELIGTDPRTDLALLKVDAPAPLPVVPLGDSESLKIGEWVIAVGSPFGLSETVTAGIVSGKGRKDVMPGTSPMYANFIQTDASINPGNSGGPLINMSGEVIGINTAIVESGQGIGFAIPVDMAKTLIPQLAKGRVERSWLGVGIQKLSEDLSRSLGLKDAKGALVAQIVAGSPADDAGIREGDVILKFDGKDIVEANDLPWLAATAGAGRKVEVEYLHEGKRKKTTVVMGNLAEIDKKAGGRQKPAAMPDETRLKIWGMVLVEGATHGAGGGRTGNGVVVEQVQAGSNAAIAGIRPGDVILKVGYGRIATLGDAKAAFGKVKSGEVMSLHIQRGADFLWVAIKAM